MSITNIPNNIVHQSYRSIANLRIENFGYALSDANKAIENDKGSLTINMDSLGFIKW